DQTTFDPTDAPRLGLARRAHTRILASPDTAAVVLLLGVGGMTVGSAVDVTFRIGAPPIDRGPTASSFVVGTRAPNLAVADVTGALRGQTRFALYLRQIERGTIVIRDWARALTIRSGSQ